MTKGLEFDPGFAPYILAFEGTVEYLYMDINRFKNLSQKKMKFRQYYKKILEVFYNNLGFYAGCLLWASYIKTQPEQPILNNHCLGGEYKEDDREVDFMIRFTELFSKDMKYFLGEEFKFDTKTTKLLEAYKEFLKINKGFVESRLNTDILLPMEIKNAEKNKEIIDKILETGDLKQLIDYIEV